ncbi:MAG: hypothetical protein ACI86M_002750 [Saprospiraceae bacterium]|jgi:hypothetical protein
MSTTKDNVYKYSFIIEKWAAGIFHFIDGKDITSHVAFGGEAITAIDNLLQEKKSKNNIELLEDSTLFSVYYEDI